jgi:hypothetical protein
MVYKEVFYGQCTNCLKEIKTASSGHYCNVCGSEYHYQCLTSPKYFNGKCGHCDNKVEFGTDNFIQFPNNFKTLKKSV